MDNDYERIKQRLTIDPLELDFELIELPMLIMEANEHCAGKVAERDRAKNALDVMIAEVANTLRETPVSDGKGGSKVRSEAQIGSETPLYSGVQEAQTTLEVAKHAVANWMALCDGLKTKRDALKIYAELTISGYLSPNTALTQRRTEIRTASNSVTARRRPINPS